MNPISNVLINKQQQQEKTPKEHEKQQQNKTKYTTKLLGNLFKTLIKFKLNSV